MQSEFALTVQGSFAKIYLPVFHKTDTAYTFITVEKKRLHFRPIRIDLQSFYVKIHKFPFISVSLMPFLPTMKVLTSNGRISPEKFMLSEGILTVNLPFFLAVRTGAKSNYPYRKFRPADSTKTVQIPFLPQNGTKVSQYD